MPSYHRSVSSSKLPYSGQAAYRGHKSIFPGLQEVEFGGKREIFRSIHVPMATGSTVVWAGSETTYGVC